jgi:predicted permease
MAAFAADELRIEVDGSVEQVFGQVASENYFDVLGLKAAAGRLMTADDEKLAPPVAVISYGYWRRRFGGTSVAIGRTLTVGDRIYTIVGVTPEGFWGLQPGRQVEVTLPIQREGRLITDAGAWWFDAVARLGPESSVQQPRLLLPPWAEAAASMIGLKGDIPLSRKRATAELDTIFQSFMKDHDQSGEIRRKHWDHIELPSAARGLDSLRARFSKPLYALTLVAGIILMIACVNLGNLLLARGAARSREFGIRLATGAGSGRLMRQLLTETLLLFLLGAAGGLVVAHLSIQGLTGYFAIGRRPILLAVHYDWRLAAFAVGVTLAAGLLTGLWPAIRALRTDPQAAMKDGEARMVGSRQSSLAARVLVVSQVALSLVLLVAAVMFVRTMVNLSAVDLGFSGSRVLTMSLNPAFAGNPPSNTHDQYWTRVLERVSALPGIRSASLSVLTPLSGRDTGKFVNVSGYQPPSEMDRIVHLNHISEDYFETFGIQLQAGRTFTQKDASNALKVVILNETAASEYFPGKDPIGQTLEFPKAGVYRVVGVVQDSKHMSVREEAPRFAYLLIWQRVDPIGRITLSVSSPQPQAPVAAMVGREVRTIHANTLVSDVIGVKEQIDATLVSERLLSTLAAAFSALALLLAAIGLYGILSYAVARRRAEFGVRMALGARPAHISWGLFRSVATQVGIGIAIGLPAAMVAGRALQGLLYEVTPGDPANYLVSAAMLAMMAGVAAWLPARRACSIDPTEALRRE